VSAPVRLIASDLDGTLFGADHQLSTRTIVALRAAHAAGIRVVAATGRSSTSAVPRLQPAGVVDVAVCSNGSLIHDVARDETILRFPIEPPHVARFFRALSALDPDLSFCWETDRGNGWDAAFADIAAVHADLEGRLDVPGRPGAADTVTKIMVRHPELRREALMAELRPHIPHGLTMSCSGVEFVEVTGPGVDKAAGLRRVCEMWGIAAHEVVAFGDNHNDAPMLAWAGHGVAVENASASAKVVADEVIGHHADDAVADYIETIVARPVRGTTFDAAPSGDPS
jgi:Cof subfamily protein (haloacid dehalogenase superfamily)